MPWLAVRRCGICHKRKHTSSGCFSLCQTPQRYGRDEFTILALNRPPTGQVKTARKHTLWRNLGWYQRQLADGT